MAPDEPPYPVKFSLTSLHQLSLYYSILYLFSRPFSELSRVFRAQLAVERHRFWNVDVLFTFCGPLALGLSEETGLNQKSAVMPTTQIIINTAVVASEFIIQQASGAAPCFSTISITNWTVLPMATEHNYLSQELCFSPVLHCCGGTKSCSTLVLEACLMGQRCRDSHVFSHHYEDIAGWEGGRGAVYLIMQPVYRNH